ncbi:hypothetical protein [Euzebya pacifica]|uniref:hypothetical protein n=1 Tax=Euzebya pacifica TaxID=1608957 RepID=UPI0030FB77F5
MLLPCTTPPTAPPTGWPDIENFNYTPPLPPDRPTQNTGRPTSESGRPRTRTAVIIGAVGVIIAIALVLLFG